MDREQLRVFVIRPTLTSIGLWSQAAEHLLVGTAMLESNLLFVRQKPDGPAVSLFQVEPFTYRDLRHRLPSKFPDLHLKVLLCLNMTDLPIDADYLMGNITAATIFARLKYYFSPQALPAPTDFEGMAQWWKSTYNTQSGAGKLLHATKIFRSVVFNYYEHTKEN